MQVHCFISVLRNKILFLERDHQILLTYPADLLWDTCGLTRMWMDRNRGNLSSLWILLFLVRTDEIETQGGF